MRTVSFTDFRKHASKYFSDVESGESLLIIRHGRAIAEISQVSNESKSLSWKKKGVRLSIKGAELSSVIIKERRRENIL